ncbi:MAG: hypothetical protein ACXVP3_07955 [Actinomycetota bacterium]
MRLDPRLPNRLRSWFGTFAFLALLVSGLAYGATWVVRTGLERQAVTDAAKAADAVIQPALQRDDATRPMSGARYAELRAVVRKRVVNPPVTSVEIWKADGTIVFADRRSLLGQQTSSMQPTLHDAAIEGSLKVVDGYTFRALVGVGVPGGDAVVVEIDRPYGTITAQAGERWHPWVARGIQAAVLFLVLYVVAVGLSIVERRTRAAAADKLPEPVQTPNAAPPAVEDAHVAVRRRRSDRTDEGEGAPATAPPPYMQTGFREHLEARREAEDALLRAHQALDASELDRQRLQDRLNQAESELADARRRLSELGATAGR